MNSDAVIGRMFRNIFGDRLPEIERAWVQRRLAERKCRIIDVELRQVNSEALSDLVIKELEPTTINQAVL